MSNSISKAIIEALLPSGSLWNQQADGDLDKLFDGMGANADTVVDDVECVGCVRDPETTPLLSDLEREYGISTDTRLTEETRREQLASLVYFAEVAGTKDTLQSALNRAGFDVQVHENSPAVDPDIFLNSVPLMVADGDNAYAGFYPTTPGVYTSVAGRTGGYLLVNGAVFKQSPEYLSVAGEIYAGEPTTALAGRYDDLKQELILYDIPDDPDTWPFFFFVGGDATRDPVTGELTDIETADVPSEERVVFERIILKYKPLHTWAGLIVNYT